MAHRESTRARRGRPPTRFYFLITASSITPGTSPTGPTPPCALEWVNSFRPPKKRNQRLNHNPHIGQATSLTQVLQTKLNFFRKNALEIGRVRIVGASKDSSLVNKPKRPRIRDTR